MFVTNALLLEIMPSNLPLRLPLEQMQQLWSTQINPILSNPIVNGQLLKEVALSNGTTIINHGLGRKLQGWFLVGVNGLSNIYDNQDTNPTPQLTLSLNSTAAVVVSIWVF